MNILTSNIVFMLRGCFDNAPYAIDEHALALVRLAASFGFCRQLCLYLPLCLPASCVFSFLFLLRVLTIFHVFMLLNGFPLFYFQWASKLPLSLQMAVLWRLCMGVPVLIPLGRVNSQYLQPPQPPPCLCLYLRRHHCHHHH